MNTWAPVWSPIVDSSLWEESGDVVKVFMTLLATKDSDHISRMDAYKISRKCCLDELQVLDILKLLASPDKRRKVKQEFEGRRIKAVEDGWLILNGEKYRKMVQDEMRKARLRRAQEAFRRRQAMTEQEQAAFDRGRSEEFGKRRKTIGVKQAKHNGECSGAQAAIKDGLEEAATAAPEGAAL